MTREEKAKRFFEDLISETNRVLADRPDKLHELKGVISYYETAIEALEKQIPLVLVIDRKWSRCKCGHLSLRYNYCPNCGQKLLLKGAHND